MRRCLAFDFKSAEPRFLAAFTQDSYMLDAFNDPAGRDFYKLMYAKLMDVNYEHVTDAHLLVTFLTPTYFLLNSK